MRITNVNIYGLEESIKASGYPKSVVEPKPSIKRATSLAQTKHGSGHDCFLKGIVVQCDVKAPSYWWAQFQRYHFADIVASQSKMHCMLKFDLNEQCNEWVTEESKSQVKKFIDIYNTYDTLPTETTVYGMQQLLFGKDTNVEVSSKDDIFQLILSNAPMGFELTARIVTNYLQLKTMYTQRKSHRLAEWSIICDWIKFLPMASELIIRGKD